MSSTGENLQRATTQFDPFELPDTLQSSTVDDPYPYLAEARRRGSVQCEWPLPEDVVATGDGDESSEEKYDAQYDEQFDTSYNVLGYEEVAAVLRDNETYSSTILGELLEPMLGRTIVAMDEPMHRAHRALVAPAFRRSLLAQWGDELVGRVVDELLDQITPLGQADLVRRLTFAFPVRVIARILGLPEGDAAQFQRWSLELISVIVDWDRGLAAADALREYFANIVAERRRQPGNDLISELLETEYDGVRLSDDDVFAFLRLLLPAGVETTYRALGNLLFALLAHPDQLQEVVETPELRNAAIEEALRWQTPLVVIPRRTTRAVRLGGVSIPRDSVLNVFLGSANRDERRYENPDDFDIHRVPTPHISFGTGPHMCLGMHLARLEMRVALDATLSRLERLRFDRDAPIPHIVGIVLRSPDALPVRYARTV